MDVYDQEILRLADSTEKDLYASWLRPDPLFQYARADPEKRSGECGFGCLTMIRCGSAIAQTPELTAQIKADKRIALGSPALYSNWDVIDADSRIERLQPFAEWQRRLDIEIRGKTPATEPAPQPVTA